MTEGNGKAGSRDSRRANMLKLIIPLVLLLFVPLFTNNYLQYVINMIFIYILLVFGLNIILGYCGQFAFCQAAFYGIGAYATGFFVTKAGLPYWVCLPIGGLFGALAGFLLSFPARRLEKYWLAIITMSFTEIMVWVFDHWTAVTDGVNGMIVHRPSLFGYAIHSDHQVYYVNLIVCVIMMYAGWRIIQSKIGRSFVAVREGPLVAQCFGVDPQGTKILAYVLCGMYGGVAGALLVLNLEIIVPTAFNNAQGGILFAMIMIGGLGTFFGSILGAALLIVLPEILRESMAYQEMAYGFLLLLILIFLPRGLAGLAGRIPGLPRETFFIR